MRRMTSHSQASGHIQVSEAPDSEHTGMLADLQQKCEHFPFSNSHFIPVTFGDRIKHPTTLQQNIFRLETFRFRIVFTHCNIDDRAQHTKAYDLKQEYQQQNEDRWKIVLNNCGS